MTGGAARIVPFFASLCEIGWAVGPVIAGIVGLTLLTPDTH
jgi:hypothetical protein